MSTVPSMALISIRTKQLRDGEVSQILTRTNWGSRQSASGSGVSTNTANAFRRVKDCSDGDDDMAGEDESEREGNCDTSESRATVKEEMAEVEAEAEAVEEEGWCENESDSEKDDEDGE